MNRMYNCTAHSQEKYVADFAAAGFDIEASPRIKRVESVSAGRLADEGRRAASGIPDQSHVLIGGAQIIIDAASIDLLQRGCRLYAVHTERVSDGDGGFVFNFAGLSETPMSVFWQNIRDLYVVADMNMQDCIAQGIFATSERVAFENATMDAMRGVEQPPSDAAALAALAKSAWDAAESAGVPAIWPGEEREAALALLKRYGQSPNTA